MRTVVVRLAAPLQAWGSSSRFNDRYTDLTPTKSGVVGMVSAALGYRRDQPELMRSVAQCRFAARADQPGVVGTDFQVAQALDGHQKSTGVALPLSNRYYLEDAVFVVALEYEDEQFAAKVHNALLWPVFTAFLGRKSCLPCGEFVVGLFDESATNVLTRLSWRASPHEQSRHGDTVSLNLFTDSPDGTLIADEPQDFNTDYVRHTYRGVARTVVMLPNPGFVPDINDAFFDVIMSLSKV